MGVPGLINAYKVATEDALTNATVIEKTLDDIYSINFNYGQMNDVMKIIKEDDLAILEQAFDNNCMVKIAIRKMQVNRAIARLEKIEGAKIKLIQ